MTLSITILCLIVWNGILSFVVVYLWFDFKKSREETDAKIRSLKEDHSSLHSSLVTNRYFTGEQFFKIWGGIKSIETKIKTPKKTTKK